MKSRAGAHRDFARDPNVIVSLQLARLENDFQMRVAARFFGGGDFVENAIVIAGEKNAAIDHHVDFIGAIAGGAAHFLRVSIAAA